MFFVCGIGSFGCFARLSPSPLYDAKVPFAVPQGRVFAGYKAAERTARGNGTTYRFFLLPYGIMAENQPFNNRLANDSLIDIKTNLLYYRMIVL